MLLMAWSASAQNSLSGTVTDSESGETLPGTTVYFPDLHVGATVDGDGKYEIKNLPRGTFLVEADLTGYSRKLAKITLEGETHLDLELSYSVTEMGDVVITGNTGSVTRQVNPVPTIVINNLSGIESPSTNVIDAIAQQPGISQITTGSGISKPVIRGLGFNRVVVLNNNVRQEGQQWGDEHGTEIDQYSVNRVEIIKGPGSLMYGSDAMAGVINFLAPKPVEEGTITAELMGNYQTNNHLQGYSASTAGSLGEVHWLGRVSSKRAGNFQNALDGKVYNSGFEELNFNGNADLHRKWGFTRLFASSFNQTMALPEGERDSLGNFVRPLVVNDSTLDEVTVTPADLSGYTIGIPRQMINHLRIGTENQVFIKNSLLSFMVAFQQNRRREFGDPFDPSATELYFLLNTLNYNVRFRFPDYKGWQTSTGLNGMWQSNQNRGEEFLIPQYSLWDGGIFAFTQKSFDRLHLAGGVRFDHRGIASQTLWLDGDGAPTGVTDSTASLKFAGFERNFNNVSASLGGSYSLNEVLTLKLNLARGFRSPNLAELASNGRHEGTFRYEVGDPDLRPETSLQTDAGLIVNTEHLSIELSLFDNSIQNFIFAEKLRSVTGGDSISDPGDPAPTFKFVQGRANLLGGELAVDLHPHPLDWLHIENSFAFVNANLAGQPDSTRFLPFTPAPRLRSELRADFDKVGKCLRSAFFKVDVAWTLAQNRFYSAYGTETATPGYALLNAALGADLTTRSGRKLFSFSIAASNLLDASYQSHLSRLKYAPVNLLTGRTGVFNMGRNISLRLVVPLEFRVK
ncbi:MAG: TonB-dependent receptor [Bacteroidia bacterium]|nr:TonB-dependent receptor [Bacteroidia bacterium]